MGRIFTTIESAGAREMEQPKVGPKGEGAGATASKDTENTEEAFGAFLQEGAGSQRRTGVFAGVVPVLTKPALSRVQSSEGSQDSGAQRRFSGPGERARPRALSGAPRARLVGYSSGLRPHFFFHRPAGARVGTPGASVVPETFDGRCRAGGSFRIKN